MKPRCFLTPFVTVALALGAALVLGGVLPTMVSPTPAAADACYTWNRTLRLRKPAMQGEDVRQLQIRVAGWGGFRNYVNIDGVFGPETEAAVKRFQQAYRLAVDGIAGPQTFATLYELQDADCTPKHFAYEEFDNSATCGEQDFGANAGVHNVSAATVRARLLRVMWKLEALRRQLDLRDGVIEDTPLVIASGFRSHACQLRVSDAHPSQHEYGMAADITPATYSLCTVAVQAQYAGFSTILGPGYPGHDDHVHLDMANENPQFDGDGRWDHIAPSCGINWQP